VEHDGHFRSGLLSSTKAKRPHKILSADDSRQVKSREMVPAEGFEPPTYGLQNRCTTTVLSRHA
jgi:hypothetical protein